MQPDLRTFVNQDVPDWMLKPCQRILEHGLQFLANPNKDLKSVYHYASTAGFAAMINDAFVASANGYSPFTRFRTTSLRTQNDPREGIVAPIAFGVALRDILRLTQPVIEELIHQVVVPELMVTSLFCFSRISDSVAMYRSYCPLGGVCLEFDLSEFDGAFEVSETSSIVYPLVCKYINTRKLDREHDALIEWIMPALRTAPEQELENRLVIARAILQVLTSLHAPSYKDHGSNYENEIRLVVQGSGPSESDDFSVGGPIVSHNGQAMVEHRYVNLKLSTSPLKSVTFSPFGFNSNDVDLVQSKLAALGLEHVEIRKSEHHVLR